MLIHRYWSGDEIPLHEPWLGQCLHSLNPGLELKEWRDEDLPDEYEPYFNDSQVRDKDRLKHRANIVRLLLLLEYGGVWYDYDVVPLLPVLSLPYPSVGAHRGLCNSFMFFEHHDTRIDAALKAIVEQPESDNPSTVVSGSIFLRLYLYDVHYLEFPFDPTGNFLHAARPFAIHLGGSSC